MGKKKAALPEIVQVAAQRRHDEIVDALRDGRKQRAARFADRRKEANRKACRGRFSY